jgi:predicted membrane protein
VDNPAFVLKLTLIMVAGVNAAMFHGGAFRTAAQWDQGVPTPAAAKLHGAVSLIIWASVIACGRLLAYL